MLCSTLKRLHAVIIALIYSLLMKETSLCDKLSLPPPSSGSIDLNMKDSAKSWWVCFSLFCLLFLSVCTHTFPSFNWLPAHQVEAQNKKQQEQLERLRKDLGAVDMTTTPSTGRTSLYWKQNGIYWWYFIWQVLFLPQSIICVRS